MSRFVVLLRGVNVGKGNRVPMAEFRAALEELGFTAVQTLLNSGNAVFSSASRSPGKLATDIASCLHVRFDVVTPVIVKSAAEFTAIVDSNPIAPPESENSRFLVAFAMDRSRLQELNALQALLKPGERLAVTDQAAISTAQAGCWRARSERLSWARPVGASPPGTGAQRSSLPACLATVLIDALTMKAPAARG